MDKIWLTMVNGRYPRLPSTCSYSCQPLQQMNLWAIYACVLNKTHDEYIITHRIHVWYIYLHGWLIFIVRCRGKYTVRPIDPSMVNSLQGWAVPIQLFVETTKRKSSSSLGVSQWISASWTEAKTNEKSRKWCHSACDWDELWNMLDLSRSERLVWIFGRMIKI